jgi:chromosome segregation ATPase
VSKDRRLIPALTRGLEEREAQKQEAEQKLAEATAETKHLDDDLKGLLEYDRSQIAERRRLRDQLRRIVRRVNLYPTSLPHDLAEDLVNLAHDLSEVKRCFQVVFWNGTERWVLDSQPVLIVNVRDMFAKKEDRALS